MEQRTERFVEKMGLLFEADGASRTAGRMLGLLLLSAEPKSLDELMELLQVSKASVSTNARALERFGAIERLTRLGDRRDYYQAAEAMPLRLIERRVKHLRCIRDLMSSARCADGGCDPLVDDRLEQYASFFDMMITEMTSARESWLVRNAGEDGDDDVPVGRLRALG